MITNTVTDALLAHSPIKDTDAMSLIDFVGIERTLPVDPFLIAEKLGISLSNSEVNDSAQSGRIDVVDGEVIIWVNPVHHINRQRFTVAHELGHYIRDILPALLDNEPATGFKDNDLTFHRKSFADAPEEFAANLFAAELLMPTVAVMKYSKLDTLTDLAKRFCVSKKAMQKRLDYLGI
jgi:Zn-dependent peptidase ImmA (M78 family)